MVQFKRKPVKFEPPPPFITENTEIWGIEETGEVFTDYDKYLARRDFYQQKLFTCESTGHSSYTYFEALESEAEASKEINSIFPEGLRARVLEYVQFRNTARMDDLVNVVFDHFKEDFMLGDKVTIEGENGRRHGVITQMTDTSRLHNIFASQNTDDSFRTFTYVVTMDDNKEQITKYKATELQRDRKVYSKLVLKQFLRGAVSRESWNGAPWTIKDHLAKRYNISTKVPEAKTRDAVIAARKAANGANNGGPPAEAHLSHGLNGHTPLVNGNGQILGQGQTTFVNFSGNPPYGQDPGHAMAQPVDGHYHPNMAQVPLINGRPAYPLSAGPPPPIAGSVAPHLAHLAQQVPQPGVGFLSVGVPFQPTFMQYQTLPSSETIPVPTHKQFEPIKYPIEDLEIRQPRVSVQRPPLKFFSDDVPEGAEEPPEDKKTGIRMKSIGPLLCAWETLNVHDTIYMLDSFTLDDFVDAMCFSSEEIDCELLVEVHCSVLKQIVDDEGKLQAPLPHVSESDESDEEEESSPEPTPEPEPPVRTTRSSLRKSEANQLVKQRTPTPEPPQQAHNAAEFLSEYDWIEQCKIRNFRDGGWEAILVGLLHRLSFDDTQKDICDEILAALCPADEEEPTPETIAYNYVHLDVNLRITALEIVLRLTVATETFRDQLIAASQEMTRLRKEKIEFQRKRKELADELFKLDIERKIQLPLNTPASPSDSKEKEDVAMAGTDDAKDATEPEPEAESSEEPTTANRKLRHTNKNKRKAEAEAAKKEKAKKAKAEAAKTKQQKEWEKLLTAIEKKKDELKSCEASITELDDDLRETLVHRSKVLGKDRFLNKYYWFEHNGMPYGGVPNSSTAEYGYANGRIWVQGPDEYEFQPNLEEPALSQDMEKYGFTVPQRKEKEEGETHLSKSTDWGYYDDPEDIDKLLAWLDERGVREKALRKELLAFRDRIAEYMVKMREHLTEAEKSKAEGEENATRVSTRTKTYVDKDTTKDRCLLWTNSIMREEYGYSHLEEYEPPRKSKGRGSKGKGRGRK